MGASTEARSPLEEEHRDEGVAGEEGDSEEPVSEGAEADGADAGDGEGERAKGGSGADADSSADADLRGEGGQADGGSSSDAESSPEAAPVIEPLDPIAPSEGGEAPGFVAAGFGEIPAKKRRRALKALGITAGVLVAIALAVYIAGAAVFMGRFMPGTSIGGNDVSLKTDAEVSELLESMVAGYQLDVIGGGFAFRTTSEGIGLSVDSGAIVSAMHADMDAWQWPVLLATQPSHDETERLQVSFDQSAYDADVVAAVATFNETARAPVNATIAYDEKADKFIVKPEEAGTQFDAQAVTEAMAEAIARLDYKLSLGDAQLIQPTVLSTDEKLVEAAELATGMVSARLTLVMGGQSVGEVSGDMLSEFITINDDYEVVFKKKKMTAWVESLAEGFDTVGTERTYTRADGKQIAVSGGVYGWDVDTEALKNAILDGVKAGTTAQIEVPCNDTAAVYNGANQRDWGNRYIDVDITEQHVRFYGDDGKIIWEADCISGEPDGEHDTVKGVWYVNNKESPSKLIGYEKGKKIYETSVKYWMPFEGNGIGFHDATWQPSFGGAMYANGYGSHGCVNLSYDDAEKLYSLIQIGDVVVVHG